MSTTKLDLSEFYRDPRNFALRMAGLVCQCCQKPNDRVMRHPDGWRICVECDTCPTCGERARNCECSL